MHATILSLLLTTNPLTPATEPAFLYADRELPKEGTLQKTEEGLVYLKVSDRYVYELLPMLPGNLSAPPYFGPGLIGANIPIICPGEVDWKKPPALPPLGTRYTFTLDSLTCQTHQETPNAVTACALLVQSPDLDKIRINANLPPHPLDILIGVQYLESTTPPLELSEIESEALPLKNRVVLVD